MTPFCASNFPHIPGRTAPRRPGTLLDNQPSPQEVLAGVEGAFRVAWSSGEGRALHRALLRLLRCCQRTQELAAALAEQVSVSEGSSDSESAVRESCPGQGSLGVNPLSSKARSSPGFWASQEPENILDASKLSADQGHPVPSGTLRLMANMVRAKET